MHVSEHRQDKADPPCLTKNDPLEGPEDSKSSDSTDLGVHVAEFTWPLSQRPRGH